MFSKGNHLDIILLSCFNLKRYIQPYSARKSLFVCLYEKIVHCQEFKNYSELFFSAEKNSPGWQIVIA